MIVITSYSIHYTKLYETAYTWGATITDCDECHGDSAGTMTSNAHGEHVNSSYAGWACGDCHTGATASSHIDGTLNLDGTKVTYAGGDVDLVDPNSSYNFV